MQFAVVMTIPDFKQGRMRRFSKVFENTLLLANYDRIDIAFDGNTLNYCQAKVLETYIHSPTSMTVFKVVPPFDDNSRLEILVRALDADLDWREGGYS